MVREALMPVLTAVGVGLVAVGAIGMLVAWLDERAGRGWSLGEGAAGGSPLQDVASSPSVPGELHASSLCEGCGQLHPPEALPLELLLWAGVEVSAARWFGRGRV